jgi:MoaA/NifB/PqqE/SkfB family radical SAM enzyme
MNSPKTSPAAPPKSTRRVLTTRSVLYLGYPCNIRCRFCYYTYAPTKRWRTLEEVKEDARIFRHRYGQDRVDITGGEPTVFPDIFPLVAYCRDIGLRPTIITNTQKLADPAVVSRYVDHGLFDFLCSVHAIGSVYDDITQARDGWSRLEKAIENLNDAGVPWRANCTLTRPVIPQLEEVARFVDSRHGRVLNFISFNPFYEWEEKGAGDFQARHSEIRPHLVRALEHCDRVGLEANVRYMPFCMMKGHEEKCYNFQQLSYDSHEWSYATWVFSERGLFDPKTRWLWRVAAGNGIRWLGRALGEERAFRLWALKNRRSLYRQGDPCAECGLRRICDRFTKQYADRYGFEEADPYLDLDVSDPLHFITRQEKVVD